MNFKPGDKVVYARPFQFSRLKTGGVYTVSSYSPYECSLDLVEVPNDSFNAERFDLFEVVVGWDANGSPIQ